MLTFGNDVRPKLTWLRLFLALGRNPRRLVLQLLPVSESLAVAACRPPRLCRVSCAVDGGKDTSTEVTRTWLGSDNFRARRPAVFAESLRERLRLLLLLRPMKLRLREPPASGSDSVSASGMRGVGF
ncbi:hypothetical protein CERSUDRAFT_117533 [Gelatoporia subvermispora B]|uniref:Uncharacterized protein n=1 Tax=Ceriporiopsis subvermispora (strain B) TaxID=914234 RepID=M2QAP7_CERS8|nr:hypothetical protein CERSUDRAFT_117533 [Gelatoporia subvermispora B]